VPSTLTDTGDAGQAAPLDWRHYIKVHPAADEYPLMRDADPAGFAALVEDIRAHGIRTQLVFWLSDGDRLLDDGRNRLDVLNDLGVLGVRHKDPEDEDDEDELVFVQEWDGKAWVPLAEDAYQSVVNWSEKTSGDPYAIAASHNVHRRHLNREYKRGLIAKQLKREPEASNNSIGKRLAVDDKTVASVRAELEGRSEIPNVKTRKDTKGRKQPAKKRSPVAGSQAVVKAEEAQSPIATEDLQDSAEEMRAKPADQPGVNQPVEMANDDLSVEELAVALKKIAGKKLTAALDLVPEMKEVVIKYALRQYERPQINRDMTNALRAGLGTRNPSANQTAIIKITMEMERLGLDRNDVSIVVRKPQAEFDETAPHDCGQGESRLIPAGNGRTAVRVNAEVRP
jgi:hypothetical protein